MALLLLFAATPKDFLHGFTGHRDTVHQHHDDDGSLGIGKKHHHCSFLSLMALPYEGSPATVLRFTCRYPVHHIPLARPAAAGEGRAACCPASRGPPAA